MKQSCIKQILMVLLFWYSVSTEALANWLEESLVNQGYSKIQMAKVATGHDIIEVKINGVEGLFVVDSGAISIVNNSVETKYKLNPSNKLYSKDAAGAAGPIKVDFFAIDDISIAGVFIGIKKMGSSDINAVAQGIYNASGKFIDGIIGQDILIANQAFIDVETQVLYLKSSTVKNSNTKSVVNPPKNYQGYDLNAIDFSEFEMHFLSVDTSINHAKGLLLIDSGAGRSILDAAGLAKFKLDDHTLITQSGTSGAGGGFGFAVHRLSDFKIKNQNFNHSNFAFADLSALVDYIENNSAVRIDGVMGQDVLIKYGAIVDVGGQKLYLKQ